jgi:hypothetical protein
MNHLFENEYIKIGTDKSASITTIKSKKICDDITELDKNIALINHYIKDTKSKKIIFSLTNLDQLSKESLLKEKLFPTLGSVGVKEIAVVTGTNKKVQSFISEIGFYVTPVKEHYRINSETFEDYQQAIDWMIQK